MNKDTHKNNIRRYLNGAYMMSEVDELHDSLLRASLDGESLDEVANEVWEEGTDARMTTAFAEEKSYKEAQELLHGLNRRRKLTFTRLKYAVVGIAASLIFVLLGIRGTDLMQNHLQQMAEVSTSFGERKQITLSDGSRIVLNACSSLRYPEAFDGDVRKVQLNGQAFFEIAHNEEQPFFVEAGNFHVQVLGTEFDVKSYADDEVVSVEVKSGRVEVTLPEATLRLKKQEQILMNTVSGEYNKKKGNKVVASWRKGSICFNHTPIRDVARELERIYHCDIKFCEGQVFANVITGEHDNQNLDSVLESLRYVSGVKFRKEADGSILLYK